MLPKLLMKLFGLLVLVVAVAGATDDIEPVSSKNLRALQSCTRKDRLFCPAQAPIPGSRCCYLGSGACGYGSTFQRSLDCKTIDCLSTKVCSCLGDTSTTKTWTCTAIKLPSVNPAVCEKQINESTPPLDLARVPMVGKLCSPNE